MNKSEKQIFILFLVLFFLGLIIRYVPWHLPEIGELPVEFQEGYQESLAEVPSKPKIVNKLLQEEPEKQKPPKRKKQKKVKVKFPIAINSASDYELCAIPGVGPKLAEKILEYKNTHEKIKNEADLLKIPGIGKKKAKNILKNVIFD